VPPLAVLPTEAEQLVFQLSVVAEQGDAACVAQQLLMVPVPASVHLQQSTWLVLPLGEIQLLKPVPNTVVLLPSVPTLQVKLAEPQAAEGLQTGLVTLLQVPSDWQVIEALPA